MPMASRAWSAMWWWRRAAGAGWPAAIEPHRGSRRAKLLPPQLRRLLDPVEPFQRENRIRQLVGAAVQDRARQGQKLLLHHYRVRERIGFAGRIGIEPLVHAVVGGDGDARAERMATADLQAIVLYHVEFFREHIDRGVTKPVVVIPAEAALV